MAATALEDNPADGLEFKTSGGDKRSIYQSQLTRDLTATRKVHGVQEFVVKLMKKVSV